jgi:hypothetical protein
MNTKREMQEALYGALESWGLCVGSKCGERKMHQAQGQRCECT